MTQTRWRDAARAIAWTARALEHATSDLTLSQYRVLALVASGPDRAAKLAERARVARGTLTTVIDGLVELGFIRRAVVEGDRRGVLLEATRQGLEAIERAEAEMAEALKALAGRASDPQRVKAGLLELLEAFATAPVESRR